SKCSSMAGSQAAVAARRAAFSGNCSQANAIVAAATAMGAGQQAQKAVASTSCKSSAALALTPAAFVSGPGGRKSTGTGAPAAGTPGDAECATQRYQRVCDLGGGRGPAARSDMAAISVIYLLTWWGGFRARDAAS